LRIAGSDDGKAEVSEATVNRRLSRAETRVAKALGSVKLPPDVFPIADPDLAALSELLHRMQMCQEDTPATRMAGEAIRVLRAYVVKVAKQN
jgi:hypothetical protein